MQASHGSSNTLLQTGTVVSCSTTAMYWPALRQPPALCFPNLAPSLPPPHHPSSTHRTTKSKKNIITNLEILALREKDYPVDAGEHLEFKDRVQMIAWEPKGTRFVVVHGDTATPTVSFYQVRCRSRCWVCVGMRCVSHTWWCLPDTSLSGIAELLLHWCTSA